MYTTLILSTLSAISFAAPLVKRTSDSTWDLAPGSKTTCDTSSDKIIGFYDGPQLETVVNDACAAMMAPCAYQERLPAGTICAQVTTWPLSDPAKRTQAADVETADGNISGFELQCKCTLRKIVKDLRTDRDTSRCYSCTAAVRFCGRLLDTRRVLRVLCAHAREAGV